MYMGLSQNTYCIASLQLTWTCCNYCFTFSFTIVLLWFLIREAIRRKTWEDMYELVGGIFLGLRCGNWQLLLIAEIIWIQLDTSYYLLGYGKSDYSFSLSYGDVFLLFFWSVVKSFIYLLYGAFSCRILTCKSYIWEVELWW